MPPALRPGPGSGPKLLGVLAGVVLVLTLVVTGRVLGGPDPPSPVRPPATVPTPAPHRVGDRPACPHTHPVLATADGRSYPLGHPTRPPPSAGPVGCYATVADAAAAGYPQAPLPAGALELGGVYLVPVPEGVRRDCRRAAGRLGFAVPCPRRCARGPAATPGSGSCSRTPASWSPRAMSALPGGRPAPGRGRGPAAGALACAGARPVGEARVRGGVGGLFECPPSPSPHDEGLLLRWREGGIFMALSVTGHLADVRRLVLALATHLELAPA